MNLQTPTYHSNLWSWSVHCVHQVTVLDHLDNGVGQFLGYIPARRTKHYITTITIHSNFFFQFSNKASIIYVHLYLTPVTNNSHLSDGHEGRVNLFLFLYVLILSPYSTFSHVHQFSVLPFHRSSSHT